jgi:hypothetical protein
MHKKNAWLLPQGIEEMLPEEAKQLEALRRQITGCICLLGI